MSNVKPKDNIPKIAMPVCPFCKTEMVITEFNGYYESLCFWSCDCDEDELKKKAEMKWRGSYT